MHNSHFTIVDIHFIIPANKASNIFYYLIIFAYLISRVVLFNLEEIQS